MTGCSVNGSAFVLGTKGCASESHYPDLSEEEKSLWRNLIDASDLGSESGRSRGLTPPGDSMVSREKDLCHS